MHTMHLLPSVAIQPNLGLKTWPKQLLGSLPLVIVLPRSVFPGQGHWQFPLNIDSGIQIVLFTQI
jgi:hypothetical protein